VTCRRSVV